MPSATEVLGTICLALGVLHTFTVNRIRAWADRRAEGSLVRDLAHLLSEVEVVFMLWAGVFANGLAVLHGTQAAALYLDQLNYTEPLLVFVVMAMSATRPVVETAERAIHAVSRLVPVADSVSFPITALVLGPLLGSFITEPAAMTLTALLLKKHVLSDPRATQPLKYALLGTLFVNVSVGGTLTTYAAPPVVMVAEKFHWGTADMIRLIGWKAAVAVLLNSLLLGLLFLRPLRVLQAPSDAGKPSGRPVPFWLVLLHGALLAGVVAAAHHIPVFMALFLFFLGVVTVTKEYQDTVELRQPLLVAGFLGGLVVLGGAQEWWVRPTIQGLQPLALYLGATALTAVTDNAALTYLGSQVPLTPAMRYALVAGSVTGGGLTVIANAPNPAGYSILVETFGERGLSPVGLFVAALAPTAVAMACFLGLPSW
jgi:Putative Na+/H+ antiporter